MFFIYQLTDFLFVFFFAEISKTRATTIIQFLSTICKDDTSHRRHSHFFYRLQTDLFDQFLLQRNNKMI